MSRQRARLVHHKHLLQISPCVKQELTTTAEKHKDFATLKRKFPTLLNPEEDEELLYDKERAVKKPKPTEAVYVYHYSLRVHELIDFVVKFQAM